MSFDRFLYDHWILITAVIDRGIALVVSAHVVLSKRDSRSAVSWIGLIWLTPLLGAALYWWLGINRIQRRARRLRPRLHGAQRFASSHSCTHDELCQALEPGSRHLRSLAHLVGRVSSRPLLRGNRIQPLTDGDEAYPAMLNAIDGAQCSISLCTYLFDNDQAGLKFVNALQAAVARGVQVRVLVDDMGARYSWPTIIHSLRIAGIPCATFMPTTIPWRFRHSNLRTHRKILVVDGCVAFTGGMNIREGHCLASHPAAPVRDLHFRVEGPVVSQIQGVFTEDWAFCTGELLDGPEWLPELRPAGDLLVRGVPDGPDEDLGNLRNTLLGAIAAAEFSIRIVTPYFVPDSSLTSALAVAALRGVQVDLVLPGKNNIRIVQWASQSILWQVVERGCRVWISPPPFDHTKLLIVDDTVSLVGSSNWDARSLRLNFEFNLECYGRTLAGQLGEMIDERIRKAHRLTLEELNGRSLPVQLRDGVARLFSPYL